MSPIPIWTSCYLVNGASIDVAVVVLHYPHFIIINVVYLQLWGTLMHLILLLPPPPYCDCV